MGLLDLHLVWDWDVVIVAALLGILTINSFDLFPFPGNKAFNAVGCRWSKITSMLGMLLWHQEFHWYYCFVSTSCFISWSIPYLLVSHTNFDLFQIKFFHKVDSLPTPVTDTEKLIWGVLEAERPAFRLYLECTSPFSIYLMFKCFLCWYSTGYSTCIYMRIHDKWPVLVGIVDLVIVWCYWSCNYTEVSICF